MAHSSDIRERHSRRCNSRSGERCNCEPSYQARVWIPEDGKRKTQTFSGKGAKTAAKNWLTDSRKAAKDGKMRFGDHRITVKAWLETWVEERAPQDASPRVVS